MAARVYSDVLWQVYNTSTPATLNPIDVDGNVVVLRDIDLYYRGSSALQFYVYDANADTIIYALALGGASGSSYQWRGRQVFRPGAAIGYYTSDRVDFRMSGYRLSP